MSTSKILGIIVLIAVLGFGGYYVYQNSASQEPEAMMEEDGDALVDDGNDAMMEDDSDAMMDEGDGDQMMEEPAELQTVTVKITDAGFVPSAVNIKKGDSVTWVNEGSSPVWPASAAHPTHTVYPGSNIAKCGTDEGADIFDACKGLSNGESWTFQFNQAGSWNYHDHLNASHFGKVNVSQ